MHDNEIEQQQKQTEPQDDEEEEKVDWNGMDHIDENKFRKIIWWYAGRFECLQKIICTSLGSSTQQREWESEREGEKKKLKKTVLLWSLLICAAHVRFYLPQNLWH